MRNIRFNENIIVAASSLVFTILALIALDLMLSLMRSIGINILNDSLIGNVLLETTILVVQILIIRKYSKEALLNSISLKYEKESLLYVFKGATLGLIGIVTIYLAIFVLKIGSYEGTGFEFYDTKIVLSFVIGMAIRAFFAGVCEEVFFRGVLLNYLAKYKGKTFGLLASAIIFTLFHCSRYNDLYQLSSVFLCGITLGYLFIRTNSLYLSIGLHFATDFLINLVGPKNQPSLFLLTLNPGFDLDYLTRFIFIFLSALYILLLIVLFLKKNSKKA